MTALSTRWWVGGKKQQQQADKLLGSLDFGRHLNNGNNTGEIPSNIRKPDFQMPALLHLP